MKTFFLSFPRLTISLTCPDGFIGHVQAAFFHSISPCTDPPPRYEYVIESTSKGLDLLKDGQLVQRFGSWRDLICRLEEDIENTLIRAIGAWIGFHAGAVMIGDSACLIPGNPDSGKTTTTFNLIEMGHIFLCEEVTPVDPETFLVHPYPRVLYLDGNYTEKYVSFYPAQNGELEILGSQTACYRPYAVGSDPVPLKIILIPEYDPSQTPGIQKLSPDEVFTELLGYCFPMAENNG